MTSAVAIRNPILGTFAHARGPEIMRRRGGHTKADIATTEGLVEHAALRTEVRAHPLAVGMLVNMNIGHRQTETISLAMRRSVILLSALGISSPFISIPAKMIVGSHESGEVSTPFIASHQHRQGNRRQAKGLHKIAAGESLDWHRDGPRQIRCLA